jgi:hypothetical protein
MKPRVPPPRPHYLEFLAPFEPRIRQLALATRKLVLEEARGATELIYDAYNAVATGFSFTGKPGDACMHIAVYAHWVNLGFNRGSQLEDPDGVLSGNGRWIRHIRISTLEDLRSAVVRSFVKKAVAAAERSRTEGAESRSVVRAIYARKRRPEPGKSSTQRGRGPSRKVKGKIEPNV